MNNDGGGCHWIKWFLQVLIISQTRKQSIGEELQLTRHRWSCPIVCKRWLERPGFQSHKKRNVVRVDAERASESIPVEKQTAVTDRRVVQHKIFMQKRGQRSRVFEDYQHT